MRCSTLRCLDLAISDSVQYFQSERFCFHREWKNQQQSNYIYKDLIKVLKLSSKKQLYLEIEY